MSDSPPLKYLAVHTGACLTNVATMAPPSAAKQRTTWRIAKPNQNHEKPTQFRASLARHRKPTQFRDLHSASTDYKKIMSGVGYHLAGDDVEQLGRKRRQLQQVRHHGCLTLRQSIHT